MSRAGALLRSTHPGPSFTVTAVTIVLGIGVGMDVARLALLALAVLLQQFSVGLSNDWIDVERDRQLERTDKPIASGELSLPLARTASYLLAGSAILLTTPLGWWATLAHLGFLAAGWTYNAGLKSLPASVATYVVGFGLLPCVVTLALPDPRLPAIWTIAVGALLGVSAHFANALPDIDGDRRLGIRGLPQLVGQRWSVIATSVSLIVCGVLVVVGPGSFDIPRLVAAGLVGVLSVVCWWLGTTRAPSRILFRLILGAALLIVTLLGLSGRLLLA